MNPKKPESAYVGNLTPDTLRNCINACDLLLDSATPGANDVLVSVMQALEYEHDKAAATLKKEREARA